MYSVLQCKQTETFQHFGDQHGGSDNCSRLSSEFYIDSTLGALFCTIKDCTFILPIYLNRSANLLRWQKTNEKKSYVDPTSRFFFVQQKYTSLSKRLSNLVLFSGAVLSCYFLFICSTHLFTSNFAISKKSPNGDVGEYVIKTS